MLTQLNISQFTVVDALEVSFVEGLTVITGETGAGKSILLDALGLCLGDRADPSAIRPGSDKAEISARFAIEDHAAALDWLRERDLEAGDECLFRRVLTREGRSRAYINGHQATLQDCAALGELLIDIHGQHAHQSLLHRSQQRALLDGFGSLQDRAERVAKLAGRWREINESLVRLRQSRQDLADREQLLRYQVSEFEELAIAEGELQSLEEERRRLANAEDIQRDAADALQRCEDSGATVRGALTLLDPKLHRGDGIDNTRGMLESAAIQIEEARSELQAYLAGCNSDPERLAETEKRLEALYGLARKHRIQPEQLHAHFGELSEELASLDSSDERVDALQTELDSLSNQYRDESADLSKGRRDAARKLRSEVQKLLKKLSMANCKFEISLQQREDMQPHPNGAEDPVFLISTNPGAEAKPLAKVASGGELSRIGLAIQVATAGSHAVPSMVFDEVDAGIGGGVAEVVGKLLATMGLRAQVFCVTHLPQVASQGTQHLLVEKKGKGKQLSSSLRPLASDERVREIARMLGGLKLTKQTLAHAKEMLEGDP